MIAIVGFALGIGLVLVLSPLLWPRRTRDTAGRWSPVSAVRARLGAAGLDSVSPVVFAAACVLVAAVVAAVAHGIIGIAAVSAAAGAVALLLPWLMITWRANMRRRSNRALWPDVVDHLVSAVRSGLALPDGVSSLAHVGPTATRSAFAEFERDYRATGSFSRCLDRLKSGLSDPVADRILETLRMAREVGGTELTLVLRGLAANLREEAALRGEVEARQSWVVNAARLGVAAPWIVLAPLSSRPEAAQAYNTPAGTAIIVCGLLLTAIAYRIMIALGRLPEEKRWFG